MKKTSAIYGLIMGAILVANLIYMTILCYNNPDFKGNDVVGYAVMIIVFSMIFVAVKQIRDKQNNGFISFSRAFKTGLLITFIASTMYVVIWLFDYYLFIPDFIDRYTVHVLKNAKADGASAAEISKKAAEMANFKEMYKNPLFVVLITYAEVFPIGLLISLISAFILKRKPRV